MTLWVYAQWPKKWPFEGTLNDPENEPLSVRSMTQKMTLWAYAQKPKKWSFERTLKDPKNDPLSVCSRTQIMTLWAYDQGPKKWPFELTLKDTFSLYIFTWVTLKTLIKFFHFYVSLSLLYYVKYEDAAEITKRRDSISYKTSLFILFEVIFSRHARYKVFKENTYLGRSWFPSSIQAFFLGNTRSIKLKLTVHKWSVPDSSLLVEWFMGFYAIFWNGRF